MKLRARERAFYYIFKERMTITTANTHLNIITLSTIRKLRNWNFLIIADSLTAEITNLQLKLPNGYKSILENK